MASNDIFDTSLSPAYERVTKLRKVGGSLGVILPREALNVLGFKEGDALRAVFSGGQIVLIPIPITDRAEPFG